jgi:hypothetical protein
MKLIVQDSLELHRRVGVCCRVSGAAKVHFPAQPFQKLPFCFRPSSVVHAMEIPEREADAARPKRGERPRKVNVGGSGSRRLRGAETLLPRTPHSGPAH